MNSCALRLHQHFHDEGLYLQMKGDVHYCSDAVFTRALVPQECGNVASLGGQEPPGCNEITPPLFKGLVSVPLVAPGRTQTPIHQRAVGASGTVQRTTPSKLACLEPLGPTIGTK